VESTTTGRVNPFGLTYDDLGYMYGVDCHSSPIYQLIQGGDYPHFGKKPTGIGYAPFMMRHEYGSTALAGLEYYVASDFPEEFQNNFYYGDVVMSRVLRSSMQLKGTTPVPKQETDFIVSDDPWFRPVDVKLGPDGALYVADFYNRIIGHYEVPLDHPGRDRQRGRIWRITYTGQDQKARDWTKADMDELIAALGSPNRTIRMLVADRLTDHYGKEVIEPLLQLLQSPAASPAQKRHSLWILYRLRALPENVLANAIKDNDESVRVHALRIVFEYDRLSDAALHEVVMQLADPDPHVKRMAVMVISKFPDPASVTELIALRKTVPEQDSHLLYSVRQSLRDQLRDKNVMASVNSNRWSEADSRLLADVLVGVDSDLAALYLVKHTDQYGEEEENFIRYARHTARYLPINRLDQLITLCLRKADNNPDLQFTLFTSLQEGLAQRGAQMTQKGRQWGMALAGDFLKPDMPDWRALPFGDLPYPENPWRILNVPMANESESTVRVLASDPEGVQAGVIVSPEFTLTEKLQFYLVGHKKEPLEGEEPLPASNRAQLRLSETDEVIAEAEITDVSVKKQIEWNIKEWAGKIGYLTLLDGSATRREYIGIGGLVPPVIDLPAQDPDQMIRRQIFACEIARDFGVRAFLPYLDKLATGRNADVLVRAEAFDALLAIDIDRGLRMAEDIITDKAEPDFLRERILKSVATLSLPKSNGLLASIIPSVAHTLKRDIALALAKTGQGTELLFTAARGMELSPAILLDKKVAEQLASSMTPDQHKIFEGLTKGVKPPDEEIQTLIETRLGGYSRENATIDEGARLFNQNCRACHEIKEQGGNIGPQLDGIGSWGIRALTEKILDPNRNISKAFISYVIKLKDGSSQTGLLRREEGNVIIFANAAGQEFSIPKSNIAERRATPFTLMPDRFGETLTQQDYNALLTYLLSLK